MKKITLAILGVAISASAHAQFETKPDIVQMPEQQLSQDAVEIATVLTNVLSKAGPCMKSLKSSTQLAVTKVERQRTGVGQTAYALQVSEVVGGDALGATMILLINEQTDRRGLKTYLCSVQK